MQNLCKGLSVNRDGWKPNTSDVHIHNAKCHTIYYVISIFIFNAIYTQAYLCI